MEKSAFTRKQKRLRTLLRQIRVDAGLRQVDVADRLNEPQSFVSKYERGERQLDFVEVDEVCEALGITVSEFVRKLEES